jgi:hypothetical protein
LASVGLLTGLLVAAVLLQGSLVDGRGHVGVSYPAGEVKEVRVLDAVNVYYDGEPRPGFSVFGGMALLILGTAGFMTFAALRFAGARRRLRSFWAVAAFGLAVAGTDELLAIHESVGHNLRFLADVPGVKRPDDLLLALYLPGALVFAWWFRDILVEHRFTVTCIAAGVFSFGVSVAGDLTSSHIEEWAELVAGLFLAAGLISLMHRHLKDNLHIRVAAPGAPAARRAPAPAEPGEAPQPALQR